MWPTKEMVDYCVLNSLPILIRILATTLVIFSFSYISPGQTTLPTSFDFATSPATLPSGWSTNTTANYSSGLQDQSGGTSRAGKLQSTNHQFTIHFYDEPGSVSYYLRSYGTNSFMGTLVVEESEDGNNWNAISTYNNGGFGSNWTQYTSTPDEDSRYIRFRLSNKVSGTNAGIDNVLITQNITSEQEMNAVYDDENVPNGTGIAFAEAVNTTLPVKIGIENLGTSNVLSLGSATISGVASADYSINANPSNISASSADTLIIDFTPSSQGNRIAQISIPNNDANEDPYVIDLNGIGGLTASEPIENPSTASTTYLRTWRVNGSFEDIGADGYITLVSFDQSSNDSPEDGSTYELGEGIGNSKVLGIGPNPTYRIRSAMADSEYYLRIFAYNGNGSTINYRTSDPLETSVTTPVASMQDQNYWQGIDETSTSFVDDLHALINVHNVRFYSNYDEDMVPGFYGRDTINNQEVITGVYSGEQVIYTPPFDWTSTNMNREHTLPASWMPSAGNSGTPEYQDLHHLFPTVATANSQRGNRPLGNVANTTSSYGEGKAGTNANGNNVYEPRTEQKGDAARAIMYMMTAYGWSKNDLQSNGTNQSFSTLLEWHLADLPSEFERSRNDYVDSLQQNRNPFVDSAHWVCYIDFNTMSYVNEPDTDCLEMTGITLPEPQDTTADTTISIREINAPNLVVSIIPNPATNWVTLNTEIEEPLDFQIYSLVGRLHLNGTIIRGKSIDVSSLENGSYFIRLQSRTGQFSVHHLIIQH